MAGNDHKDGSWRVRDLFLSYGFVLVMALVLVIYSLTAHNFLALGNIMSILQDGSPLLIIASGASLVILAGRIDISVGSMAFLSACVGTMLIVQFHWPILPSVVAILLCGLVLGMLNGLIVVFLRVSPLITTLGTMIAFRGLALQLSNAQIIGLPGSLRSFGNARIGPLFVITLLALAVLLATHIMHTRTSLGRDITALGNGDEVASRLGIHVRKISFLVFAISGLLSGLAGLVSMCQVAALNSRLGSGMEFTAIAAIIIGGISLFGGEGTIIPGLLLGAYALTIIENGLNLLSASPFVYPFVRGAVIFLAMYADSLKFRVRTAQRKIAAGSE